MMTRRDAVAVFDTPLVRDYQLGTPAALAFFKQWVESARPIGMSGKTALVLRAHCRDESDRTEWRFFFEQVEVVLPLSAPVAARAAQLLDRIPLPTRLTADDALVAATALLRKLPVYSLDPERYAAVPGLTALPAR